jgi:hypothetical protein
MSQKDLQFNYKFTAVFQNAKITSLSLILWVRFALLDPDPDPDPDPADQINAV